MLALLQLDRLPNQRNEEDDIGTGQTTAGQSLSSYTSVSLAHHGAHQRQQAQV
jgi:hypothetical protein